MLQTERGYNCLPEQALPPKPNPHMLCTRVNKHFSTIPNSRSPKIASSENVAPDVSDAFQLPLLFRGRGRLFAATSDSFEEQT